MDTAQNQNGEVNVEDYVQSIVILVNKNMMHKLFHITNELLR